MRSWLGFTQQGSSFIFQNVRMSFQPVLKWTVAVESTQQGPTGTECHLGSKVHTAASSSCSISYNEWPVLCHCCQMHFPACALRTMAVSTQSNSQQTASGLHNPWPHAGDWSRRLERTSTTDLKLTDFPCRTILMEILCKKRSEGSAACTAVDRVPFNALDGGSERT